MLLSLRLQISRRCWPRCRRPHRQLDQQQPWHHYSTCRHHHVSAAGLIIVICKELQTNPVRVPSIYKLTMLMSPLVSPSPPSQTLPTVTAPLTIAIPAVNATEVRRDTRFLASCATCGICSGMHAASSLLLHSLTATSGLGRAAHHHGVFLLVQMPCKRSFVPNQT
jgi:hypothetical protein